MDALFQNRIDSLRSFIGSPDEAALLTDEVNIGYFTGFFHSEGYLLVTQSSAALFVDPRYDEAARQKAHGCEVLCVCKPGEKPTDRIEREGIRCVHGEANHLTVGRFGKLKKLLSEKNAELTAEGRLDDHIAGLRVVKDQTELDKIAAAQGIAEQAYLQMLNDVKPGVSERELSARLAFYMKQKGAEDVSFDLITIAGKKTSLPHGVPSENTVCEGDFLTCDFGAVYEGYHSDTTRTVAVKSACDEMRRIYSIVLKAQKAALEAIRPGALCSEVDKAARGVIKEAGFGKFFGHSTGHGVGLNIHELPPVSESSKAVLREGMVITDEPGIYLPGRFGVRIEDMLCVTGDGFRNFVNLPKELIIL